MYAPERGAIFGLEVVSLGDINGDGISDLGLSGRGHVASALHGLLVIVSGCSDEFIGQVSIDAAQMPLEQWPWDGASLSVHQRNAKGIVTEVLVGTVEYAGNPRFPGFVYIVDVLEGKVITSFTGSDLIMKD